jgi:hypothetical protein
MPDETGDAYVLAKRENKLVERAWTVALEKQRPKDGFNRGTGRQGITAWELQNDRQYVSLRFEAGVGRMAANPGVRVWRHQAVLEGVILR